MFFKKLNNDSEISVILSKKNIHKLENLIDSLSDQLKDSENSEYKELEKKYGINFDNQKFLICKYSLQLVRGVFYGKSVIVLFGVFIY
jgi:hypothetical protein